MRVANDGNAPVAGATVVTLVLSQDQVLDAGDRAVGTMTLAADLAPRRRKVLRLRFDYPLDLPAGAWFVLAAADPGPADVVASNNAAASRAPVSVSGAS